MGFDEKQLAEYKEVIQSIHLINKIEIESFNLILVNSLKGFWRH